MRYPLLRSIPIVLFLEIVLLIPFVGCHRSAQFDSVATVNGNAISQSDLERRYQEYRRNRANKEPEPSPEQENLVRLSILRDMIDSEILREQANKLNVAATDDDVDARLTEMKASFTQEEFDKWLKQRNETIDDLRRELRNTLTETKLINKEIESKVNITDAEISQYYALHRSEFNLIEPLYHLARIVVDDSAEANTGIHALRARLENGEEFSVIAMKYSTDHNTAPNGGDMGFVSESQLPQTLQEITKLKSGQFSEILPYYGDAAPASGGYAIYQMISKEPAGQRELNDPRVQQLIRQRLREAHSQLLKNAYFDVLRNQARIQNYLADRILGETSRH